MYRDGYVIVRRTTTNKAGQSKVPKRGTHLVKWTLHRATCFFCTRKGGLLKSQPAPIEPYPGTVACSYCKPEVEPSTEPKNTENE